MKLIKIITIVGAALGVAISASCGSASAPKDVPAPPTYVEPAK